jgi:5-methylcytosine-specific restriction protein B
MSSTTPTPEAVKTLKLLRDRHNVLVSGPPATGKSLLLGQVARWFLEIAVPPHTPKAKVPLPRGSVIAGIEDWLPSPERTDRRVFRIAFHQGTKFRDWLRGLVPIPGGTSATFKVTDGIFYQAALHAGTESGASLVVIDEINRGPAVQVFGDSLVAIESDKRLARDGTPTETTEPIRVLTDGGDYAPFHVPFHLYLLAAMNRADTSVEPLDVAFLRRWEPLALVPDPALALQHLGITDATATPPSVAASAADVYLAATRAWLAINRRIRLARGAEYQLGHGVLMWRNPPIPSDVPGALEYSDVAWRRMKDHVEELFFGDVRGIAAALNAGQAGNPYRLEAGFFADTPVNELIGPNEVSGDTLYTVLRAVGGDT